MIDSIAAGVGLAVHVRVLQLCLRFKIPAVFQIVAAARFDTSLLVPGSEGAVRLVAIDQEGMAVAHDLADAADKVDIPAIISEPGVVESTTVAVVLPISISKGVRAAKIGEDSS